jgi:hypothetical protein
LTSLESLNELDLVIPEEETFEPSLAPNSLPQISKLSVGVRSTDTKNCLIALANACPNLRYLDLLLDYFPRGPCERAVHEFVTKCPKLEVIECYFSPIEEDEEVQFK